MAVKKSSAEKRHKQSEVRRLRNKSAKSSARTCARKFVEAVHAIFESLFDEMKKCLMEGSTIELRGFGTFEPRLRKGRQRARNPKTGEQLSVAPHYVAAFRAGQELKKALWDLPVDCENTDNN